MATHASCCRTHTQTHFSLLLGWPMGPPFARTSSAVANGTTFHYRWPMGPLRFTFHCRWPMGPLTAHFLLPAANGTTSGALRVAGSPTRASLHAVQGHVKRPPGMTSSGSVHGLLFLPCTSLHETLATFQLPPVYSGRKDQMLRPNSPTSILQVDCMGCSYQFYSACDQNTWKISSLLQKTLFRSYLHQNLTLLDHVSNGSENFPFLYLSLSLRALRCAPNRTATTVAQLSKTGCV